MKILVAGGAGFLGSNLVNHLLQQPEKHEIIILDSFTSAEEATVAHLKAHPRVKILRCDITESLSIMTLGLEVDQIYHLACPASPKWYQKDPVHTLKTCYVGTENLLKAAGRCGARILVASTSEVYGNALETPQKETYYGNVNPYGPRACYDEGKRVAESLCWAYREAEGLDIRIARIFNAYGPGMLPGDGRAVSNFIVAALSSQPLVITGDGQAVRCFQYVNDCVEGLVRLMESGYEKGPVNIGSDSPTTVEELAKVVMRVVDGNGFKFAGEQRVVWRDAPVDDPVVRVPDISLAKETLGWEPRIGLEVGVQRTVDWFRNKPEFMATASAPAAEVLKEDRAKTGDILKANFVALQ